MDIRMDPEYREKKQQGMITGMGVVRPGYIRFEQQLKKQSKKQTTNEER